MKQFFLSLFFLAMLGSVANAQTADEIISNYVTAIGGKDNILKVQTSKSEGIVKFGSMELPMTMLKKPGKTKAYATFQGMNFVQACYDGTTLWATNQMTMKAEKSPSDDTYNMAMTTKEDPEVMLTYKDLGYTVSKEADDKVDGTDCFVIKMTKKPQKVDGKDADNIVYYYFDKSNSIMVLQKSTITSGPGKGMISETYMSDYQEVNGVYMPFSLKVGVAGQPGAQVITITKVDTSAVIEDKEFEFPG